MTKHLKIIEREIEAQRDALKQHRVYDLLNDVDDIRIFMEKHVYAVWDFMSLLKALQRELTCVNLPWKPAPNAKLARFINEIVHGEESDINEQGEPRSHFEMYLDAMKEVNADNTPVLTLLDSFHKLNNYQAILEKASLKAAERAFLQFTFATIASGESHKIASAFTFGREDLIPDMFIEIINRSNKNGHNPYPKLTYYLERHIELDGDEHGPLSLEMIQELCGDDEIKWAEARRIAAEALTHRLNLWEEIAQEIEAKLVLEAHAG